MIKRARNRLAAPKAAEPERGAEDAQVSLSAPGSGMLKKCDGILSSTASLMGDLENELLFDPNSTAAQLSAVRYLKGALLYMRSVEARMARGDEDAFPELLENARRAARGAVARQLTWGGAGQHPHVRRAQTGLAVMTAALLLRFGVGLGWVAVAAVCAALLLAEGAHRRVRRR